MIERLEQRRLLSCCSAGMAAMAHEAVTHRQMADQLVAHYGQGQLAQQHVAQAGVQTARAISGQRHLGDAGHQGLPEASHAVTSHDRSAMDESVALRRGTLTVRGTPENDIVKITPNADDPSQLDVTLNEATRSFHRADVKRIRAVTGQGHDTVEIDPALDIPSIVNGRRVK